MGVLSGLIDAGGKNRSTLADVEEDLFVSIGSRSARIYPLLGTARARERHRGGRRRWELHARRHRRDVHDAFGHAALRRCAVSRPRSRRHLRDALLLLAAGVVVSVLIGVLMALLTFDRMPLDANTQIVGRTSPAVLDLVIAIAAGLAGAYALVRRDVANILAGVAIAITLVPVLEVAGISLGSGRFDLALGAFLLFLTNAAAIMLGGWSCSPLPATSAPRRAHRRSGTTHGSSSRRWSSRWSCPSASRRSAATATCAGPMRRRLRPGAGWRDGVARHRRGPRRR